MCLINQQPMRSLYNLGSLILVMLTYLSCYNASSNIGLHPMVDGKNLEYATLNVTPISLEENVNLYIFQNDHYVWISYDYPEGSYGTLDMKIQTDKIPSLLNLHVSSQLGEWKIGNDDDIPSNPNSDLWWDIHGWTANNLWVNGIDTTSYDTPEFKIKNTEMREVQLSKERFGTGEWKFKLKINAIMNSEDQLVSVTYPEGREYHTLEVY